MKHYQVVIVGGGPGGYTAAIRLAQKGIACVVFEPERLGGICLNWGCIPTKALVRVADLYSEIREGGDFGIKAGIPELDYHQVQARKNQVVDQLVSGLEFVFQKRRIPVIKSKVETITRKDDKYIINHDSEPVSCDHLILATGSQPKELPNLKINGESILSSTDILQMSDLPTHLVVVGGGVIGCEFASIFGQFGVQVEIVEFLPRLLSTEDEEIAKRLTLALRKRGVKIHLNKAVEQYRQQGNEIILTLSDGTAIVTERVLLSVGRQPRLEIEFQDCQPALEKGFVLTDDQLQTNQPGMYAIGDITGRMLLAHVASRQGMLVAELLAQKISGSSSTKGIIYYDRIPACTFTNPEVASVGLTEEQARNKYQQIKIGRFPFSANGKALGLGSTFGFVKAVADGATGRLVGLHIIGPQATELIAQGGILLGLECGLHDVEKIVFAHPTLSEAVMEAVEDLSGLAINKI